MLNKIIQMGRLGRDPEESLPPEPGESFSDLEDEGELPF